MKQEMPYTEGIRNKFLAELESIELKDEEKCTLDLITGFYQAKKQFLETLKNIKL